MPIHSQVIIPRAYTSKAIVFCDGMKGRCFLSDSFNRMMELQAMPKPSIPSLLLASLPLPDTHLLLALLIICSAIT